MKKERMKGFVAGLLVAVLALGLIGTAAATIGKRTVEVDYTDIKIELNGEKVTPVDANGNAVEPFAINGTTYLPVRAVSNALGLDVGWDGATSTVKLAGGAENSNNLLAFYKALEEGFTTLEDNFNWILSGTITSESLSEIVPEGAYEQYVGKTMLEATKMLIEEDVSVVDVFYDLSKEAGYLDDEDLEVYFEYKRLSDLLSANLDSLVRGGAEEKTVMATAGQSCGSCLLHSMTVQNLFWDAI